MKVKTENKHVGLSLMSYRKAGLYPQKMVRYITVFLPKPILHGTWRIFWYSSKRIAKMFKQLLTSFRKLSSASSVRVLKTFKHIFTPDSKWVTFIARPKNPSPSTLPTRKSVALNTLLNTRKSMKEAICYYFHNTVEPFRLLFFYKKSTASWYFHENLEELCSYRVVYSLDFILRRF